MTGRLFVEEPFDDNFWNDPDDLTAKEISGIRAGIQRGLEAGAAGRVKPLVQVVAEARQRHGFPANWASGLDDLKTMR